MVFNLARILGLSGGRCVVSTIHYPEIPVYEIMNEADVYRAQYAPQKLEVLGSDGGLIDDIRGSLLCKILVLPMLISLAWQSFRLARSSDLVMVQWIPTALVALPIRFFLRRPIIFHSRTYPDTFFWKKVYSFLLNYSDGVIYNSRDNRLLTEKIFKHPLTTTIGSGINVEQFCRPNGYSRARTPKLFKVITVARLVEFKGVEYAVRAISVLRKKGVPATLDILGDGPLRVELEQLSISLGVKEFIHFKGAEAHEEIPRLLWESDVFLLPSIIDSRGRTEGFGAVILEAMAAKVPVVASRVGGIAGILDGTNGILVPEKDSIAIAFALESLYCDEALRKQYIEIGFEYVKNNFSDQAMHKHYSSFITKVLKNYHSEF